MESARSRSRAVARCSEPAEQFGQADVSGDAAGTNPGTRRANEAAELAELAELTEQLKAEAHRQGFHLSGACPAVSPSGYHRLLDWIDAQCAGEMSYMNERRDAYEHPNGVMPGVQSLLVLGFPYRTASPQNPEPMQGRVSRYAWGEADYHDLIHARLKKLKGWIAQRRPAARVRGVVDTAPLLEREFARAAGIGWVGKNTMLINKHQGSYFFLAALLVDFALAYDTPHDADHCGTCQRCLLACPTDALVHPYRLDARRCISYLTIEHRSPIDESLRQGMGQWLFGCDVCQDVCPWNRRGSHATTPELEALDWHNPVNLLPLFSMNDDDFRARYRQTPLWRTRRRGILRNAAIVLGNSRCTGALSALTMGLNDPESIVRGASAWAIGQLSGEPASDALRSRQAIETDPDVHDEICRALQTLASRT